MEQFGHNMNVRILLYETQLDLDGNPVSKFLILVVTDGEDSQRIEYRLTDEEFSAVIDDETALVGVIEAVAAQAHDQLQQVIAARLPEPLAATLDELDTLACSLDCSAILESSLILAAQRAEIAPPVESTEPVETEKLSAALKS